MAYRNHRRWRLIEILIVVAAVIGALTVIGVVMSKAAHKSDTGAPGAQLASLGAVETSRDGAAPV